MNFIEQCRKDAGWPSLHRDVPLRREDQKVWSLSQEEVARFVGAVRSRSDDLQSELMGKDQLIARLSDEKAKMAKLIAELATRVDQWEASKRVKREAEAQGLEAGPVNRLAAAVSK